MDIAQETESTTSINYSEQVLALKSLLPNYGEETERVDDSLLQSMRAYTYLYQFDRFLTDIKHTYGYLQFEENRIFVQRFTRSNAKGLWVLTHGYTDHSGLNRHYIDYLLQQGFDVVAYDLPGHGLSEGHPLGIDNFSIYSSVLNSVLDSLILPEKVPYYLLGHSLGGAINLNLLLNERKSVKDLGLLQSVVLIAPLLYTEGSKKVALIHWLLQYFKTSIKRDFPQSSHDAKYLYFRQFIDPLQHPNMAMSWVSAMLKWQKEVAAISTTIDLRMLILQGTDDQTVDWQKNVRLIKAWFPQALVKEIEGGKHNLLSESEDYLQLCFEALDDFLQNRASSQ